MDVNEPVRGRKRAAEQAISDNDNCEDEEGDNNKEEEEEEDNNNNNMDDNNNDNNNNNGSDPTLQKTRTPVGCPEVSIVVDSPPRTCPKQCICVNKAGDTVTSCPALDEATGVSQGVWVERGDVSVLIYYYMSA